MSFISNALLYNCVHPTNLALDKWVGYLNDEGNKRGNECKCHDHELKLNCIYIFTHK